MNNIVDSIKEDFRSNVLGYITPEKRLYRGLAYTVNISPKHYVTGLGTWGMASPDDQCRFLRKVHKLGYIGIYKLIDKSIDVENNMVSFEFTKNGELHSHGYYILEDKYNINYKRYHMLLAKQMKKLLPKSNYTLIIRPMEEYEKWSQYMSKDEATVGYKPYVAKHCEHKNTISWFIPIANEVSVQEKNKSEDGVTLGA